MGRRHKDMPNREMLLGFLINHKKVQNIVILQTGTVQFEVNNKAYRYTCGGWFCAERPNGTFGLVFKAKDSRGWVYHPNFRNKMAELIAKLCMYKSMQ